MPSVSIFESNLLDVLFAQDGNLNPEITFTRASTARYVDDETGMWTSVASGTPRIRMRNGQREVVIEPTATNYVLHSRDWTQAAWVASNATVSKTATGSDGSSNAACIITALAGNATVMQSITLASGTRCFAVSIKRRSGQGRIDLTLDGTTWVNISGKISAARWFRPSITNSLTNPIVGIRIETSGNAVDVDFAQLEAGTYASSPIVTGAATAVRASDILTISDASHFLGNSTAMTIAVHGESFFPITEPAYPAFATLRNSDATDAVLLFLDVQQKVSAMVVKDGGVEISNVYTSLPITNRSQPGFPIALAASVWQGNHTAVSNWGSPSGTTASGVPAVNALDIGSNLSAGVWGGTIQKVRLAPRAMLRNSLRSLSMPIAPPIELPLVSYDFGQNALPIGVTYSRWGSAVACINSVGTSYTPTGQEVPFTFDDTTFDALGCRFSPSSLDNMLVPGLIPYLEAPSGTLLIDVPKGGSWGGAALLGTTNGATTGWRIEYRSDTAALVVRVGAVSLETPATAISDTRIAVVWSSYGVEIWSGTTSPELKSSISTSPGTINCGSEVRIGSRAELEFYFDNPIRRIEVFS